jgi:hypothetical protein
MNMATIKVMMKGPMYDLSRRTESFFTGTVYKAKLHPVLPDANSIKFAARFPAYNIHVQKTPFSLCQLDTCRQRKVHLYSDFKTILLCFITFPFWPSSYTDASCFFFSSIAWFN